MQPFWTPRHIREQSTHLPYPHRFPLGSTSIRLQAAIYGTPTAAKGKQNTWSLPRMQQAKTPKTVVITVLGPPSGFKITSPTHFLCGGHGNRSDTPAVTGTVTSWTISANPSAGFYSIPLTGSFTVLLGGNERPDSNTLLRPPNGAGPVKDTVTISGKTRPSLHRRLPRNPGTCGRAVNSTFARAWVKGFGNGAYYLSMVEKRSGAGFRHKRHAEA